MTYVMDLESIKSAFHQLCWDDQKIFDRTHEDAMSPEVIQPTDGLFYDMVDAQDYFCSVWCVDDVPGAD